MPLTQLEQSGFILETAAGFKLAIDIGSYTPLDKLLNIKPDAMLVSHIHGDHFSLEHIKKLAPKKLYLNEECLQALEAENLSREINCQIIKVRVGDKINIDGIEVEFFDVDHGPNVKLRPKENFGFLITLPIEAGDASETGGETGKVSRETRDQKIYFAGDMFSPSGIDVTNLEVDFALIPVGGFYTFGPSEAVSFAAQFKKIGKVIPMHYEYNQEAKGEFEEVLNTI